MGTTIAYKGTEVDLDDRRATMSLMSEAVSDVIRDAGAPPSFLSADDKVPCPKCRKKGAINDGPCMGCIVEALSVGNVKILSHLPDFWEADIVVRTMASRLIDECHQDAATARICYIFRKRAGKSNGKLRLGSCARQSDKLKMLHGYDYIIELAFDTWILLTDVQREALLLHELCHVFKDITDQGEAAWKVLGHDVEEFSKVVQLYGLWQPNLEHLEQAIQRFHQGPLLRQAHTRE